LIDEIGKVAEFGGVALEVAEGRTQGGNTKDDYLLAYAGVALLHEVDCPSPALDIIRKVVLYVAHCIFFLCEFLPELGGIQLVFFGEISCFS
jgi:hypothetical protein